MRLEFTDDELRFVNTRITETGGLIVSTDRIVMRGHKIALIKEVREKFNMTLAASAALVDWVINQKARRTHAFNSAEYNRLTHKMDNWQIGKYNGVPITTANDKQSADETARELAEKFKASAASDRESTREYVIRIANSMNPNLGCYFLAQFLTYAN